MGFISKILSRKKARSPREGDTAHKSFLDFVEMAAEEIDGLIQQNPRWYQELPYGAPMGPEQARELEIEKRALWRRVIYDAKRSKLTALRWETSRDHRVCPQCKAREGQVFFLNEYDSLNRISMHVGCRCNLVPVRDPQAD